jgi:hypothetical protein
MTALCNSVRMEWRKKELPHEVLSLRAVDCLLGLCLEQAFGLRR